MATVSRSIHVELENTGPARRAPPPSFFSVVRAATMAHSHQRFCNMLEPVIRRVVREVVPQKVDQHVASLERLNLERIEEVEPSPNLQLVFTEQMPELIYTKGKIRTKDNKPLQVKLIDTITGDVVVSPPSDILKVEIVVLDGDFTASGRNREDNWTSKDFNSSLLKERTGKPPLLVGECTASLVQGLASFGGLEFTDNSKWRRSGKFILGVTALPAAAGSCRRPRVREAVTKPFKVLERRGESYKKHNPPRPNDEVWRLKQIRKDGPFHQRLNKANIKTVEDFLRLLRADPGRLQKILGKSERTRQITIKHAKTCKVEEEVVYPHRVGQTSNMGYSTSTPEEFIPPQMPEVEDELTGCIGNGDFAEQAVSMSMHGGMGIWQQNYQQQNNNPMPTYQLGAGTSLNNMQTNSSFEDMNFGEEYDPYQRHGYPSQAPN